MSVGIPGFVTAQDSFIPPTPDGQCNGAFDPNTVDPATWNMYKPVECAPSSARLFADAGPNDVFEFELQADFDVINDPAISRANMDQAQSPGTLRYIDATTHQTVEIPITLEARGKSRYDHCGFRPLKIVFPAPQVNNIFEGASRKVKVVTHCGNHPTDPWILGGSPEVQRRRLLSEYYFYQVLQTLGSTALSTRLARITYRDDDGAIITTEYAFLREREDDACQRCGYVDEAGDNDVLTPDLNSVFQAHMYNKFVYNNDYSPEVGHNTRRCKDAALNGYYIPYDWDLTGVVRPDYFKNNNIDYRDNVATFWNWLDSQAPDVQTKVQAWHLVQHDEDMWNVLQDTVMDDEGETQMQGWYSLYMCALRCFLGQGGTMNIIEPTENQPAEMQPTDGSGRLLIRLEYGPLSVMPNQDDFEVQIGGAPALIIGGARVGSQYWLVVQTPAGITDTSALLVRGRLCAISVEDTENNAVPFGNPNASDTVLVIDTSGSMKDDRKIESAKNAAVLFINTMRDGERIGVVEYSGELPTGYGRADEVFAIDLAAGNRVAAETQVRSLSAGDNTPLGTGLLRGLGALDAVAAAQRNDVRSLILLSDGKENVPHFWENPPIWYQSPPRPVSTPVVDTFNAVENSAVRIHTISLGPDSNPELMQAISQDRGTYRHADVIGAGGGAELKIKNSPFSPANAYADVVEDVNALALPLRLSNLFEHMHNATSRQQRIFHAVHVTGTMPDAAHSTAVSNAPAENYPDVIEIPMEEGLHFATISISWTKPANKNLQILPPAGQDQSHITVTRSNTNTVYRIDRPEPGQWRIGIPERSRGERLLVTLSGASSQEGFLKAVAPRAPNAARSGQAASQGGFAPGRPIPIVLSLMGSGPVLNATVSAYAHSDANGVERIPLLDDGRGMDAQPDDGFYSGSILHTGQGGAFDIEVTATWTAGDGIQRTRIFPLSVSIPELDSDGDSISDQDETRMGLDPHNPRDAGYDADEDGLVTWKELLIGLDPFNPDSDGGGFPDGAEVTTGGNPENPGDDQEKSKDSDRDGLPDAWETAFGLNPADASDADDDGDGDGLSNTEEFAYGTSPIQLDTDEDQVADGIEVQKGTDPTDPLNRIEPTPQPNGTGSAPLQLKLYLLIVLILLLIIALLYWVYA